MSVSRLLERLAVLVLRRFRRSSFPKPGARAGKSAARPARVRSQKSNARRSPAKPPRPGGARSRNDGRTDRRAVPPQHYGASVVPAPGGGVASALEEGVWGRNLLKVSPQLAQPHQRTSRRKTDPIKTNAYAERVSKLTPGAAPHAALEPKGFPANRLRDDTWDTRNTSIHPAAFSRETRVLDLKLILPGSPRPSLVGRSDLDRSGPRRHVAAGVHRFNCVVVRGVRCNSVVDEWSGCPHGNLGQARW